MIKRNYPLVSVIIVNFNGSKYLVNCVKSILTGSYQNLEILLVDNGSTDESLDVVNATFGAASPIKIIKNRENLGFSAGNNIGLKYANGEYIVMLNNDTEVDPDWLVALVDAMENDTTIGLAQSVIIEIDGQKIQTAGWLFSNCLVRKHALGQNKTSNTTLKPVFEVPVASGACMIVRRSLIDQVGLFDDRIPFFYDDTLLSFKVWLANKRVVTVQSSRVRHIMGASSDWTIEIKTFNLLKAKICLVFDTQYGLSELVTASLVNSLNILINSLLSLKKKDLAVVYGNLHAFRWALGNFHYLWENRISHWSQIKISPHAFKEKFFRIKVPVALHIVPSKLSNDCFSFAVDRYETEVMQKIKA